MGLIFCRCSNSHWSHFLCTDCKEKCKDMQVIVPVSSSVCVFDLPSLINEVMLTHWSHFSQPGGPLFRSQSPVRKSHWLNVADNLIRLRSKIFADSRHLMAQLTRQDTFLAVVTFVCAFQALYIRLIGRYLVFTFEGVYLCLLLMCLLFLPRFNVYVEEND
jgi:hypothetical protein